MKTKTKKWLGCVAALLVALPALAQQYPAEQLEGKLLGLLKSKQYAQVVNLLESIPESEDTEFRENPENFPYYTVQRFRANADELTPIIIFIGDGSYQKESPRLDLPKVLGEALTKHYKYVIGKDVNPYDLQDYLKFFSMFKGSPLENLAGSWLTMQLWKNNSDDKALFYDLEFHAALGIDAAQLTKVHNQFRTNRRQFFPLDRYLHIEYAVLCKAAVEIYDPLYSLAKQAGKEGLFHSYKQYVYHKLFAQKLMERNKKNGTLEPTEMGLRVMFVIAEANANSKGAWFQKLTIQLPKAQQEEVRKNINEQFVPMIIYAYNNSSSSSDLMPSLRGNSAKAKHIVTELAKTFWQYDLLDMNSMQSLEATFGKTTLKGWYMSGKYTSAKKMVQRNVATWLKQSN